MSPRIGELRRRLTLEAPDDVADGAGGLSRTFVPVASVFARIEPRRRRELVDDGRLTSTLTHLITIRARDDVITGMRFTELGRRYRITTVEFADELRRFLGCWCEEEERQ